MAKPKTTAKKMAVNNSIVSGKNKSLSVKAYKGDAKTLLAFDLDKDQINNLAGFTIACKPGSQKKYNIFNKLTLPDLHKHAQNKTEPSNSSINAPIQKFRWLHVPGSFHQGGDVFYGEYEYFITPRYFDSKKALLPIDISLTASVKINVAPFTDRDIELGFTRGFVQSQAFENHFGKTLKLKPKDGDLIFATNKVAGQDHDGEDYTFDDEFAWSGFTARTKIFDILKQVEADKELSLDVFAYDLNEPDFVAKLVAFAKQGRLRVILDNATLHVTDKKGKVSAEDMVEELINKNKKGKAAIKRGKFGRFAHDKILIVRKKQADLQGKAVRVLTGSTNFSLTGMYVNSNHVLIFNSAEIAGCYADVFQASWDGDVNQTAFEKTAFSQKTFTFPGAGSQIEFNFSPHSKEFATQVLTKIAERVEAEKSSVLFAVMGLDNGTGPVLPALQAIHQNQSIFSYGISDTPAGVELYKPSSKDGILVTGKPQSVRLPPPFDQEPSIGLGHQIHHKFIVCGFNTANPVVYCGSSNLALGGEMSNGDNLIAIHDAEVATAFAIEAIALVDHFHFRNAHQAEEKGKVPAAPKPLLLKIDNKWAEPYYNTKDIRFTDRQLFR